MGACCVPRARAAVDVVVRTLGMVGFCLAAPAVAVAQPGTLIGIVSNQATGTALAGVPVFLCTATRDCVSATTNAAGFYSITRVPGPYFACTADASGNFVNEVFSDVPYTGACVFSATLGSSIFLTSGDTVQRDFALAPGGGITGRVTDAATGAPLTGVTVWALRESGTPLQTPLQVAAGGTTDSSGQFVFTQLPAGQYFVATASDTHVDAFYGDVTCPVDCNQLPASIRGTPVDVAAGTTASGRDIALALGATITGRLINRATGEPIWDIGVSLVTRVGDQITFAGQANSDKAGAYAISGLAPGSYGAWVYGQIIGFVDETWDNLRCLGGCQPEFVMNSGTLIGVGPAATRGGIDFALDRTGGINGRITDAATSQPLVGVGVRFYRREGERVTYEGGTSSFTGGLYVWPVLPPGIYYVLAESVSTVPETYPNVPCPRPCAGPDTALGTPIVVSPDVQVSNIDFQLDRGGVISGSLMDSSGGLVSSATVTVYRQTGSAATFVDEIVFNGGSYSVGGLPPGTYFAIASGRPGNRHLVDELFGGLRCPACTGDQVLAGTPIVVAEGATVGSRNFVLDVGFNLAGTVRDAGSGRPLPGVTVQAYSTGNPSAPVASAVSRADGRYLIGGLNGGPHVLVTTGPTQYVHEVFNNVSCPGGVCTGVFAVANGQVLTRPLGFSSWEVDFTLAPQAVPPAPPAAPTGLNAAAVGFVVTVTWKASPEGMPATSYLLEAGGAPGSTAVSLPVAGTSFTTAGIGPGVYFLRVRGVNAHGVGPASAEFTLVVGPGGTTPPSPPQSVDAWAIGSRLTVTWVDPPAGPVPTGYLLVAGTAPGASNIGVIDRSVRNFAFEAVPPGVYFLRVHSRVGGVVGPPSAEVMVVAGGVPAPPTAPRQFAFSVNGSIVTFTWAEPFAGAPTGYRLEAGSGPGLSNLAAFDTGNAATSLVVPGVPPGAYFVRLRARNAVGVGVASEERVVVVP